MKYLQTIQAHLTYDDDTGRGIALANFKTFIARNTLHPGQFHEMIQEVRMTFADNTVEVLDFIITLNGQQGSFLQKLSMIKMLIFADKIQIKNKMIGK